jgi:hypothetical protein
MDVPVYSLALVIFAVLYLALAFFLAIAIAITLFAILVYLVMRYGKLPDDYPHGAADSAITVIFIGITWGIFSFLGPKNPIPFIGNGLTYAAPSFPLSSVLLILLAMALFFLTTFALVGTEGKGTGGSGGSGDSSGKLSVGA